LSHQLGKIFKGTVIGFFHPVRKTASGKLAHFQMIANAFTADPFSRTGFVGAIAIVKILFFLTLHNLPPKKYRILNNAALCGW